MRSAIWQAESTREGIPAGLLPTTSPWQSILPLPPAWNGVASLRPYLENPKSLSSLDLKWCRSNSRLPPLLHQKGWAVHSSLSLFLRHFKLAIELFESLKGEDPRRESSSSFDDLLTERGSAVATEAISWRRY